MRFCESFRTPPLRVSWRVEAWRLLLEVVALTVETVKLPG
jgi:hypothetical protein